MRSVRPDEINRHLSEVLKVESAARRASDAQEQRLGTSLDRYAQSVPQHDPQVYVPLGRGLVHAGAQAPTCGTQHASAVERSAGWPWS